MPCNALTALNEMLAASGWQLPDVCAFAQQFGLPVDQCSSVVAVLKCVVAPFAGIDPHCKCLNDVLSGITESTDGGVNVDCTQPLDSCLNSPHCAAAQPCVDSLLSRADQCQSASLPCGSFVGAAARTGLKFGQKSIWRRR